MLYSRYSRSRIRAGPFGTFAKSPRLDALEGDWWIGDCDLGKEVADVETSVNEGRRGTGAVERGDSGRTGVAALPIGAADDPGLTRARGPRGGLNDTPEASTPVPARLSGSRS